MADTRSDWLPAALRRHNQNEVLAEMERALLAELDSTKFLQLHVESASRRVDALTGVWLVVGDDRLVERMTSVPGTCREWRVAFGECIGGDLGVTGHRLSARP